MSRPLSLKIACQRLGRNITQDAAAQLNACSVNEYFRSIPVSRSQLYYTASFETQLTKLNGRSRPTNIVVWSFIEYLTSTIVALPTMLGRQAAFLAGRTPRWPQMCHLEPTAATLWEIPEFVRAGKSRKDWK